jgi:hypothetical protein
MAQRSSREKTLHGGSADALTQVGRSGTLHAGRSMEATFCYADLAGFTRSPKLTATTAQPT